MKFHYMLKLRALMLLATWILSLSIMAVSNNYGYVGTIEVEEGEIEYVYLPDGVYETLMLGYLPSGKWVLSNNASNVTMLFQQIQNCKIQGLKQGDDIKLTFSGNCVLRDASWSYTGYYFIKVVPKSVSVSSISLDATSVSLKVGETKQLSATVSPNNASNKSVSWRSSNTSVATVSSSGLITANTTGNTTITCEANDGSGKQATCAVAVEPEVTIDINVTNFPDEVFRNYLLSQEYGKDGKLTQSEIEKETYMDITFSTPNNITSLKGIEYFTSLSTLYCRNKQLSSLDITKNVKLMNLACDGNQLTSLDISKNIELMSLYCYSNQLTSLDVSQNTKLTQLRCSANKLTSLDVNSNTSLWKLDCSGNELTSLEVSKNTALMDLDCQSNHLSALDVSKNTVLQELSCSSNKLTALDVTKNTAMQNLDCGGNQLTALDVSKNKELKHLYCEGNQLTALDVSKNKELKHLYCIGNLLTSLDISNNTALTKLYCDINQLTSLDVSNNTELTYLDCSRNHLTTLDVSKNTMLTILSCYNNDIKGAAMGSLIKGLHQNNTGEVCLFGVVSEPLYNEGNVCTKTQVAAAKAKGWTPVNWIFSEWLPYEGSEDILGTEVEPLTPAEANVLGSKLAANEQSEKDYYIRGMVVSIKEQFGTQYGNATFHISADGTEKDQFFIYRAMYLGNTKYVGQDLQLRVGDDVVICGKITNYLGNLPETVQNKAYVVSINGETTGIADALMDTQIVAPVYNLRGQRISVPQKGINIIGGKKVVVE